MSGTSQRQAAAIAGISYVVIIALGLFANFAVLQRPVETGDAAATVSNIVEAETLFRLGVVAFVLVLIADVVVAWALYVLFQPTSRELSRFAAWFRLVYAGIAAAALLNVMVALKLADGTGYVSSIGTDQRHAQAMLSLDGFHSGWRIALVFFGAHLLLLGVLMVKADFAPSALGVLVAIAGLGYAVVNLAPALMSSYEDHQGLNFLLLAALAIPGEFGLTGWLLWKAGRGRHAEDDADRAARAGRRGAAVTTR